VDDAGLRILLALVGLPRVRARTDIGIRRRLEFVVMAGPCSIESEEQLMESAYIVKKGGGHILRGGAFKPRTSPYSSPRRP
jgi:3-deoxy-D-arabino-heptulosonate 7-phosphate (DAHP) synthase